jgi:hypothetical protein
MLRRVRARDEQALVRRPGDVGELVAGASANPDLVERAHHEPAATGAAFLRRLEEA